MLNLLYRMLARILSLDVEQSGRIKRIELDVSKIAEEQARQSLVLQKILAAVEPLPAVELVFIVEKEGETQIGVTRTDMTNSQQLTATIQPIDKKGNSADVDGIPQWAVSDETVITVTPSANGLSAVIAAVGPLGTARVSVTADADLGAGVKPIFGTLDVTITQGDAVGFKITTSDPVEQGSTPTP